MGETVGSEVEFFGAECREVGCSSDGQSEGSLNENPHLGLPVFNHIGSYATSGALLFIRGMPGCGGTPPVFAGQASLGVIAGRLYRTDKIPLRGDIELGRGASWTLAVLDGCDGAEIQAMCAPTHNPVDRPSTSRIPPWLKPESHHAREIADR